VAGTFSVSDTASVDIYEVSVEGPNVSFSVDITNTSPTAGNTQTWDIYYRSSGGSYIFYSEGSIPQGFFDTASFFRTFGYSVSGNVRVRRFNAGGALGSTATLSFTTEAAPAPPPPPPPSTPAPVFSDATVASPAIRGAAYTDGVTASNTNSYSVFSGALPAGISLNTSTGAITGTPTTLGTSTFVIRATGNGGNTNTATLTILVNPPAPVFSDQAITTSWIKTRNFDAAPDRTVVASDVASYLIVYSGTGLNPTSWLTINSSGQLSGLPPALGAYTFVIRATNVTGSTDSTLKTLTINPPGNRRDATNFQTDMILTKRYTGTQWVNVTTFKRYNGTAWVDIVN
jgi:hypothetical protein